jgi:hypothetical protein
MSMSIVRSQAHLYRVLARMRHMPTKAGLVSHHRAPQSPPRADGAFTIDTCACPPGTLVLLLRDTPSGPAFRSHDAQFICLQSALC